MQRLALEDEDGETDAVSASDFALPLTESLPRVLLEQTARSFALGPVETASMIGGRLPIAAFAGFDFALRCVAAVIEHPLGDNRSTFREAAFASAAILSDDLHSHPSSERSRDVGLSSRGMQDGDATPEIADG